MNKPKGEPPRKLEVDTGHEAFAVKLKRFLADQDEAHKLACRRQRERAVGFMVAAVVVGFFGLQGMRYAEWHVILVMAAFFGGLFAFGSLVSSFFSRHDELQRARGVQAFFTGLRCDLHPRTAVKGQLDLGEATDMPTYRTGTSPYSGATKRWHRHKWLNLRWAFADGNLLRLELIDLVKTKGGTEIRREHQVKGWLHVSDRVYRAVGTPRLTYLKATSTPVEGGWMIWFWGYLKSHDALALELREVYKALEPGHARRHSA